MKNILSVVVLLILFVAVAPAADDFIYHGSILWNNIRAIVQGGDYLFCAFHDGVGTINLDLDFSKKKLYSSLEIEGRPYRLHLFDDILVVENEIGTIDLVDVIDPANIRYLGSFSPGLEIFDLERIGDYLYAALEYDGIFRYDISDPSDIRFDDSSMAGIRVIQLEVYDSRLYALDDYNGIQIYEPDVAGFGPPVSELLLPIQAVSFTVADDTVYAGFRPNGYMVGTVTDLYNPLYLGTRESYIRGDYITATAKGLVFANSINGFELIYNDDSLPGQLFPMIDIYGYPEAFYYNGRNYIAYPHSERGFVVYDIDDPEYIDLDFPNMVYAYPGPITQVQFMNSRLHTIGVYNWYEIYDLSDPDYPYRSGKMINPPYRPIGMCSKGDTIFVADKMTNTFFPGIDEGTGDPMTLFPFITVVDSIARPKLIPDFFGDMDLLYFFKDHRLNGSARNNLMSISNVIRWSFPTGISAALIDDSLLYRVSDKGVLFVSQIDDDYQLMELTTLGLPGRVNDLLKIDTLLYMAAGGLRVYSIRDPLMPTLVHTVDGIGTTYELQRVDTWLVCAARTGVHIFDISGGIPEPLFSGGSSATLVSIDDQTIAASDGHSVRIYTMPVSDIDDNLPTAYDINAARLYGYPNPFNPEIKLVLENFSPRPRLLTIDVYDVLGRRVRRLHAESGNAIRTEVYWDGRGEESRPLPSGMYFFRAGNGREEAVFKAILLK